MNCRQPAPGETNADIRHVSIRHGAHAVVVRVSLTDLRRTGNDVVVGGTVKTNEGLAPPLPVGLATDLEFASAPLDRPRRPNRQVRPQP